MNKLSLFAMLALLSFSFVHADDNDHPTSKITGETIDLSTSGHTIAGRVGDKLIFGDVGTTNGHKTSHLTMKVDGETINTVFTNTDGVWGGSLQTTAGKTSDIKFIRINRDIPSYIIDVNGKEYTVRVEAEDFRNNHFIRPTYILELDGKEISAKMHDGQACYMYSLHLIFMIYGSYLF